MAKAAKKKPAVKKNRLKGTETEKNILKAFAGESQAANRYTFYSKAAKKEGYEQISAAFAETAAHERAHAKTLFRMLEGGEVEITDTYPAGKIGTTVQNLKGAAMGEHHEYSTMYKDFAAIAKKEGFPIISKKFELIAVVEKYHEKRYKIFLKNIEKNQVFKRPTAKTWVCRNCGFTHKATKAPEICPLCDHPKAHFEIAPNNF